jgi:hypothetical protein
MCLRSPQQRPSPSPQKKAREERKQRHTHMGIFADEALLSAGSSGGNAMVASITA